ncbi:hypothetical protein [Halalkalicoccus salilacus]|uniref:hypothetical protein n=1 Tax=Halalkalicoccus TaxID=332246 RepID=UPI002F9622C5
MSSLPAPKSMLFCWRCDHESPIEEDWHVHERADHLVYECPRCETAVTVRGR